MKYLLRACALLTLALSFTACPRHPFNLTVAVESQTETADEYTAEPDVRCAVVVNRDGDVTERCP